MVKIDLKKEWKHLYRPSTKKISVVDVPPLNYLKIDGTGDPNTALAYQDAIQTLYPLAYAIKFMLKRGEIAQDYTVMPLEGLWWVPDMAEFTMADKNAWLWTAMILQPEPVTPDIVTDAIADVAKKKNPPAIDKVRFETYHEGLCVQIMYIGPYADEGPTIERLHQYAWDNGYELAGKHHEIYLSDVRRTAPEKLKTIIRQPVK